MQREIKFRVWDKEEKRFIEWFNPDPYIRCADGEVFCHERNDPPKGDSFNNLRFFNNQLIIQQYVGLKDKNDKEIYEGDIVKVKFHRCGEQNCEIIYDMMGFEFFLLSKEEFSFPMAIKDIPLEIEVIGNIYENH